MSSERTRWKPGQSGNPSGRPKAAAQVARMVREATDGGGDIVRAILAVAKGQDAAMNSPRVRWAAWEWLADRAFGKPVQPAELVIERPEPPPDMSELTDEELDVLAQADAAPSGMEEIGCAGSRRAA